MTLQDWAAITTIIEAFGTVAVGFSALAVSRLALRAQREALPVSLRFLVLKRKPIIDGQSDLMIVELKNTGVRAYLHDVYVADCQPRHLMKEHAVHVWFVTKGDSLPEDLDSMQQEIGAALPWSVSVAVHSSGAIFEVGAHRAPRLARDRANRCAERKEERKGRRSTFV